jgi:predicted nucleic acid-binding protein
VILVDSSVIFDHTRNRDPRIAGWFKTNPVAVCGIVRAEVLHGARSPGDRANLVAMLNRFAQVPIPDALWDMVGDNLALLRSRGLTVPLPDAVIATVALVYDIEAWARDRHFPEMQKHLPALKLFQEPP